MSATELLQRVVAGTAPPLERLTVDQYHQMIRAGILREGAAVELIDGFLVHKDRAKAGEGPMTIGEPHAIAVDDWRDAFNDRLDRSRNHARSQQPVTIPPRHEPEPDGAVIRGPRRAYLQCHPTPLEVLLIAEVADSSLDHDRTTKLAIYATANVPHYWIINLIDRQVEVYSEPSGGRYARRTDYHMGDVVPTPPGVEPSFAIPVSELIPPTMP